MPSSRTSPARWQTRARGVGRCRRRWAAASRFRHWRPHCSPALTAAATPSTPSASCRPCDSASVVTPAVRARDAPPPNRRRASGFRRRASGSDALVLFGATGDLAFRKIFPAVQALVRRRVLNAPDHRRGPRELGHRPAFASGVADSLRSFGDPDDRDSTTALLERLSFVAGDYRDPDTFRRSGSEPRGLPAPAALPGHPAEPVPHGDQESAAYTATAQAGVVVEKPFGRDLRSARALNRVLRRRFDESAIYRIDHYLGKESVQNLLYFRFANSFLEPIWNRHFVDSRHRVDGRGVRRGGPRPLLRGSGRAARRRAEPSAAGGRAPGDGAALRQRRGRPAR